MARRIGSLFAAIAVVVIAVWLLMMRGPQRIPNVYHQRGIITIVAGNGHRGFSGDGGPATKASLSCPEGIALGKDGSLYIADSSNQRVRKVNPSGIITTIAGNGWYAKSRGHWAAYFSGEGVPATKATLNAPQGVAVGPDGSIYIADSENHRVRKVDRTGIIRTVAGGSKRRGKGGVAPHNVFTPEGLLNWMATEDNGLPALKAAVMTPTAVAADGKGNVYFADLNNARVGRISAAGIYTTVAGFAIQGYFGDGYPATKAGFWSPRDVALAPDGSMFIADTFAQVVRKVNPKGIITTFAGDGWNKPWPRLKGEKFDTPHWGRYNGDDLLATQASLNLPWGIAPAPDGSVYIADARNFRVRRVDHKGVITTVAGDGHLGCAKNGQLSTAARFASVARLAVDPKGNLYISDWGRNQVYKVTWERTKPKARDRSRGR